MAFLNWSNDFSVNNLTIDTQHKKLVQLLNDLFEAMSQGKGGDVLEKVFNDLLKYTVDHFSTEEAIMKLHNYPDAAAHKAEHDKLTQEVVIQYEKFKSGNAALSVPLLNFLKQWLSNHILSVDMQFGKYLAGRGVK